MTDPILQVHNLTIAFLEKDVYRQVVQGVSFALPRGKILGVVGESGSGKSMTALAIMQLLPSGGFISTESSIHFQQRDLCNFTERQMRAIRGRKIGMIFQDAMSAFNPVLTIRQQLNEALASLHLGARARKQRALSLLEEVGIEEIERTYNAYPHELSGGMRQRAMIAQALCSDPDLIIADEPTTALDVTIQAQVLNVLLRLRATRNVSILFITHDLGVVANIADEVAVMEKGSLIEIDKTQKFFKHPKHDYSKKLLQAILVPTLQQRHDPARPTLLTVSDLQVHFPQTKQWLFKSHPVKAVDGVSFTIPQGETLALVGESGSGKTTVAKAVIRLLHSKGGSIEFENQEVLCLSNHKLKNLRKDMQIIFQDPYVSLNPRALVVNSILEGVKAQKSVKGRAQQLQLVDELLMRVGLKAEHKWRYPHEFSGGERQRICIARALALRPKLLILDEPTSSLDVSIQLQILDLLKNVQAQYNMAYLLITHTFSVVSYLAHSLAVMYHGKIVEQGDAEIVLKNPQHPYAQKLLNAIPFLNEVSGD